MNDDKNTVNILGVNVANLSKNEILEKIKYYLESDKQYNITTPNPEFILKAHEDEEFFYILNKADLSIPDGVGLKVVGWLMGGNIHITPGSDLVKEILNFSEKNNKKVAIINWRRGLSSANEITLAVKKLWPNVNILVEDTEKNGERINLDKINTFAPDILFSSLGFPEQEKFIFHNLKNIPSVKIGMGVGGSFDFLTGKRKRAPKIMRAIGLEWLWRLVIQPSRWKRIYNATFGFLYKFIKWKFWNPMFYRPNVACIVFKKEGSDYKIILVKRSDKSGHWQIPQGGTDGENIKTAGLRELWEELGVNKFGNLEIFKNLYKYKFTKIIDSSKLNSHRGKNYKGQKQSLLIAEFLGKDNEIKINHWDHNDWKWVDADRLVEEVNEVRRDSAKIFLEKFKQTIEKYEK